MLAFLRRPPHPEPISRASRGFTLLELLTVLFIIGLSASLVAPNLPTLLDRVSFALERDTLLRDLNALPYAALNANRDFVLFGDYAFSATTAAEPTPSETIDIEDLGVSVPYRSAGIKLASLAVPQNWNVVGPTPIFYRSSGFCTGGSVVVSIGKLEYTLLAQAPYCLFSEAEL